MPFANGYFDLLFTVGAYHHFGDTPEMLLSLIPFVKKGGYIAMAIPGIKYEFGENVPDEMKPFWNSEVARTIHSLAWWKNFWLFFLLGFIEIFGNLPVFYQSVQQLLSYPLILFRHRFRLPSKKKLYRHDGIRIAL